MQFYCIVYSGTKEIYLWLKYFFQACGTPHVHSCCVSEQGQGREQPHETEAMVAMQMCKKYVVYVLHLKSAASQLYLSSFGTVYHKEFLTDVEHL